MGRTKKARCLTAQLIENEGLWLSASLLDSIDGKQSHVSLLTAGFKHSEQSDAYVPKLDQLLNGL
jgi:hypothetical protein